MYTKIQPLESYDAMLRNIGDLTEEKILKTRILSSETLKMMRLFLILSELLLFELYLTNDYQQIKAKYHYLRLCGFILQEIILFYDKNTR